MIATEENSEDDIKIKNEIKDYSVGVFARGKEVDFDKYDGSKPRIEEDTTTIIEDQDLSQEYVRVILLLTSAKKFAKM